MRFIDTFITSGIISGTKLSQDEAYDLFVEHLDPERYTLTFNASPAMYDGASKTINVPKWDLNEEALLHEIGHAKMSLVSGSANWLLKQPKGPYIVSKGLILQAEHEAWEWAIENSTKRWGTRSELIMKRCLASYYNDLPELMVGEFRKVVVPYDPKKHSKVVQRLGFKKP